MIRVVKESDLWLNYNEPDNKERFSFRFLTCEWCYSTSWGKSYTYRACVEHMQESHELWLAEKRGKGNINFNSLSESIADRN